MIKMHSTIIRTKRGGQRVYIVLSFQISYKYMHVCMYVYLYERKDIQKCFCLCDAIATDVFFAEGVSQIHAPVRFPRPRFPLRGMADQLLEDSFGEA
jgi:hypothetical protein